VTGRQDLDAPTFEPMLTEFIDAALEHIAFEEEQV